MNVDKGTYSVKTLDTVSGKYTDLGDLKAGAGVLTIPIDMPAGELALEVRRCRVPWEALTECRLSSLDLWYICSNC